MANTYYPPLQEGSLRALLVIKAAIQAEGLSYLDDANYSAEIVTNLRQLFTGSVSKLKKERPERNTDSNTPLDLEAETRSLYDELVNFTVENDGSLDTGEILNAIKTRTQLLEKLLSQLERASEVKKYTQFREFVIQKMQAYMTPDERNQFMQDLESLT